MELKITKEELTKTVNIASKGIANKNTMVILDCFLITAQEDEVRFTANSTELGVEVFPEAEIIEDGSICVDSRMFSPIVSKLPDGDVTLKTDGENLIVKGGRAKFSLAIHDGSEFPAVDVVSRDTEIKLTQEELKDAIRQTVFCASVADTNKLMTGCLMSVEGDKLKITALDGHRIAIRELTLDKEYEPVKAVVPSKTLQELVKSLSEGDIDIYVTDSLISFSFGNCQFVSRLIQGDYFDVNRMLNFDFSSEVTVDRQELYDCMDRAILLVKEIDRKPVVFTIGDTLKADIATQLGSLDEEIEIKKTGENLVIGINPRFLNDVLRVLDEREITMSFNGSKAPCYIKGEDYLYLILPVQVAV